MRRRAFVLLSAAALALAPPALAERKTPKIGFLSWFPPAMKGDLDRFREGMRQLGYVEGKDYEVEVYFTAGDPELTRSMAAKLVKEPVDIIVAVATPAIHIAKAATQTIPIVMYSANALATGLVPSLSHPRGNLTGVSLLLTDTAGKRVEFLRQIMPDLRRLAFLGSRKDPNTATFVKETQTAADQLGVKLFVDLVEGPEAIDRAAFVAIKGEGCEAVIVQPIFTGYQDKLVPMAMKVRLPVVSGPRRSRLGPPSAFSPAPPPKSGLPMQRHSARDWPSPASRTAGTSRSNTVGRTAITTVCRRWRRIWSTARSA